MPRSPLDLDHDTMQRLGHRVADVVAEHLSTLASQPAQRSLPRREMERLVAAPPPEHGEDFESLLTVLRERVFPYHAREPHPGFMGYIPSCPTFPAVLGDWLATGYDFFAGVWPVAAGPNALELVVLDWFRQWVGMPEGTGGLLTSGGSQATLTAVLAARHAAVGDDASRIARLTAYTSEQAHSSVARAAWIAGVPRAQVRALPVDDELRLRPDAREEAIARDRAAGLVPFLVAASAGTTNTGAVDPLHAIADLCERDSLWLHVDAAYAGFATLTARGRSLLDGLSRAHTLTLDPHKWLFVPFECGCLLARDPARLADFFRIYPEYLKDVEPGAQDINFADYGEQLTRYSRALKIWLSVRYFGTAALSAAIEQGMTLADHAARRIERTPELELLAPVRFGIVCFRARPDGVSGAALDALNERLNVRVNATGRFLISSTRLRGAFSLRMCPLGFRTTEAEIDGVLDEVLAALALETGEAQRA